MANPQIENGKTEIANELVDALARFNFTAHEMRILWVIMRKTYGWHKKTDRISYSQFEVATGIDHRHIGRTIKSLKTRNVITCTGTGYQLEYGIQKDYDKWDLTPSEAPIIDNNLTPSQDNLTPSQDILTPSEAPNLTPSEAHTKAIKHITKASTKAIHKKETFEEYVGKLINDFPTLDVKKEWDACQTWYEEKGKKISLPKTALNNWLKIALQKQLKFSTGGNLRDNAFFKPQPPSQKPNYIDGDAEATRKETGTNV